jgi:succinyl-diaminopimelate desuccinylase
MTAVADAFGVIHLASQLVAIPSVNGHEAGLAAFLADYLRAAGLQVAITEVMPGRPNVLALLGCGAEDEEELGLLFHAHTDTVAAHGMKEPFSGRLEDGYLWGRGSVDQKGGLAAAAAALAAFARQGKAANVPIGLAAVVDEESEHRGSMALAQSSVRAKWAVVTEPSGLRVVVGCKGTVPLRVRVHGRAAHGCRPWLGVNAVEKGMKVAEAILAQDLPEIELPGLASVRGSINLGVFEGGMSYNIVPDRCELWFDRRTVPGESQSMVLAETRDLVATLAEQDSCLEAEVEIARPDWDWEPIARRGLNATVAPLEAGLQDWVSDHHARVTGSPPQYYFTDGYNEMDFLINDLGIPAVQYGPGDSGLCHTDEERLDVAQLVTCTEVFYSMIEETLHSQRMGA